MAEESEGEADSSLADEEATESTAPTDGSAPSGDDESDVTTDDDTEPNNTDDDTESNNTDGPDSVDGESADTDGAESDDAQDDLPESPFPDVDEMASAYVSEDTDADREEGDADSGTDAAVADEDERESGDESDVREVETIDDFDDSAIESSEPTTDDATSAFDGFGGFGGEGPQSDREMPLADHIEEMVRRTLAVAVVVVVVTILTYPFADETINFLWNSHIPGAATIVERRPRLYGPLELILTKLKVSMLAGFILGLPVFVYQTYRFMRPGLYPHERRYYLASVPTSLILALVGVTFAHFVVLPAIFAYFTSYTVGTAVIAFGLRETFNLILILMGYMAVVFQIPLFIMLGIMMGLVTRRWLEEKRLLFWGGFLGLAFLVSPDPTGMAPIIVAATMIVLYEGTLALLRWTGN